MNTYHDYYLHGSDREEIEAILLAADLLTEHDGELYPVAGLDMHHVGVISTGGEWDEDGNEIVAPTIIPGWHVNLRAAFEVDEALIADVLIETPATPLCIWG